MFVGSQVPSTNAVACTRDTGGVYILDRGNRIALTDHGEKYFCAKTESRTNSAAVNVDKTDGEENQLNQEDFVFKQYWATGFGFHSYYEHLPVAPPMPEEIQPKLV